MSYTTTKEHFKIFKKECAKWIEFFGLKDWEVRYIHEKDYENLASISFNVSNGNVVFSLSIHWGTLKPTIHELKITAFHEVVELLLARLRALARARYVTPEEIIEANHAIIRRMENSVFKESGRTKR